MESRGSRTKFPSHALGLVPWHAKTIGSLWNGPPFSVGTFLAGYEIDTMAIRECFGKSTNFDRILDLTNLDYDGSETLSNPRRKVDFFRRGLPIEHIIIHQKGDHCGRISEKDSESLSDLYTFLNRTLQIDIIAP
jgi:hypothetical protein